MIFDRVSIPLWKVTTSLTLLSLCAPLAQAAEAVPDEVLVTTEYIFDPEFDIETPRYAWTNPMTGDVFIGDVDPATGAFLQLDGKGVQVDTGGFFLNNGPEWVGNDAGPRIVYSRFLGAQRGIVGMAEAREINGQWESNIIPNSAGRLVPIASLEPNDPNPVISYIDFFTNQPQILGWRFLNDPTVEHHVPSTAGSHGARWVPGRRALIYTKQFSEGGERQAFYYNVATNTVNQLTYDEGKKEAAFMWKAPEFDNEYVFFVSVRYETSSEIRLYRRFDSDNDGDLEWAQFKSIVPPSDGIYFWSPEPFVHNGKSYIFTMATREQDRKLNEFPKQIWMFNIETTNLIYENLSNPAFARVRLDPEVFVTDQGPFVYYHVYTPGPDVNIFVDDKGYEGMYRVDTGLGPAIP